jgi:3D (Asp-Asp-Asp) domain-containing protein
VRKANTQFWGFSKTKRIFVVIVLIVILCAVVNYARNEGRVVLLSTTVTETATSNNQPVSNNSVKETNTAVLNPVQNDEWKTVRMRVTAYCPCPKCCGKSSDGITACNHKIQDGETFAAADQKYPFGTEMIIPGYNDGSPVEVLDRGGAIYGNRLDVYFDSHQQALDWGVRYLDVKIRTR